MPPKRRTNVTETIDFSTLPGTSWEGAQPAGAGPPLPRLMQFGSGPVSRTGSWGGPPPISQANLQSPLPTGTTSAIHPTTTGATSVSHKNEAKSIYAGSTIGPIPGASAFVGAGALPPGLAGAFPGFPLPHLSAAQHQQQQDAAAEFIGAPTKFGDQPLPGQGRPPPSKSHYFPAPAPPRSPPEPMSRTMEYAAKLGTAELRAAVPKGKTLSDASIAESRGAALVDATRPLYGTHRPAYGRIIWTLPPEHDERVASLMDWISQMSWALAKHGMRRFLETKKRGALFVNAGYVSPYHPEEPVFDYVAFDRAQATNDRVLQESITSYDPATTVMLFVFLVSESYSSMAIWRRQLTLPPSVQLSMSIPLERVKKELRKTTNFIHIKSPALWTGPPARDSVTTSSSVSPRTTVITKPVVVTDTIKETVIVTEKKKKPKWWQFWKKVRWGKKKSK